jgi:hypothetical protein
MAYSENFPAQRASFMADFANAGRLDSRISFTRASTANVWDGSKHLSSENLLLQSSDFDTAWSKQGLATPTGGQSDPAGGTDGFTLVEDSNGGYHRIHQSMSQTGDLALTVYAKQTTGTRYLMLTLFNASNDYEAAVFDLAGGAAATSSGSSSAYTSVSTSQTSSGGSYYKCVLRATGTVTTVSLSLNDSASAGGVNSSGLDGYGGDGTSSIDVAFASLTTTGATDYNPTTTQIHRAYAPSLVSKSNNAARFDHTTDGQSVGILIEGQSTNAVGYSDSLASWNQSRLTATNASAVGPTGSLNAALLTPSTDVNQEHIIYANSVTTSVTGTVTLSGYFKAAGYDYVTLGIGNTYPGHFAHALFNLSTGAYITNSTGGDNSYVSSSTESVGNGWWRLVATFTTSRSNEQFVIGPVSTASPTFGSAWGTAMYTGDGYSSVLATGIQAEVGKSFASSLITSNSGSETTRAVDSAAIAVSEITGFSEGVGTVVYETGGVSSATANSQAAFSLYSSTLANNYTMAGVNVGGASDTSVRVYVKTPAGDQSFFSTGTVSVGDSYKLACRYELDNVAASLNGGAVVSDSSGTVPVGVDTLAFGQRDGTNYLNSNLKRIAIYSEALSDTNLQAITS